jgi:2-haloacid dehalogenase
MAPGLPGTIVDMVSTLVFDVNETMLDLRALDPHFERIFGDATVRKEWFSLVLRNALTLTTIGEYHDFAVVAGASLGMVASTRGVSVTDDDRTIIATTMGSLPPHEDVARSLRRLQASGLQLVALTNSPPDVARTQLTNAGLIELFDQTLSVHATKRLKPHPAVYQYAAAEIGKPLDQMMMVAAHDWDIAGAMAVGMQGAYVVRSGMALNPLFTEPTISAPTMDAVTDKILERAAEG